MKIVKVILFLSSMLMSNYIIAQENYTIILDGKEVLVDGITNEVISNSNKAISKVTSSDNGVHFVKPQENLYRISKAYNLSISELCNLNNINENSMLKVGQKLIVSSNNTNIESTQSTSQTYHLVQKGDTLFSIAKQYGISLIELKQLNNMNSNNILVNQKLRIQ